MTNLKYKNLGTAIIINLAEGHSVLATAMYEKDKEKYKIRLFFSVEESGTPYLFNDCYEEFYLTSERNELKSNITRAVSSMLSKGEFSSCLDETDNIWNALLKSESLLDGSSDRESA